MALFGSFATVRAQTANSAHFRASFACLDEYFRAGSDAQQRLQALPAGKTERIELERGAFALEQAYFSKKRSEGFFESHRAYIDIQAIIFGEEFIEVLDISRLDLKEDRTPAQDVIVYHMAPTASALQLSAGDLAILFPVDGHLGAVMVGEPAIVRKVVIKVPVI